MTTKLKIDVKTLKQVIKIVSKVNTKCIFRTHETKLIINVADKNFVSCINLKVDVDVQYDYPDDGLFVFPVHLKDLSILMSGSSNNDIVTFERLIGGNAGWIQISVSSDPIYDLLIPKREINSDILAHEKAFPTDSDSNTLSIIVKNGDLKKCMEQLVMYNESFMINHKCWDVNKLVIVTLISAIECNSELISPCPFDVCYDVKRILQILKSVNLKTVFNIYFPQVQKPLGKCDTSIIKLNFTLGNIYVNYYLSPIIVSDDNVKIMTDTFDSYFKVHNDRRLIEFR